jgi:tetratricopeptide (TPR) repeat protein
MKNPFLFIFIRWWERAALNNFVTGQYARAEEFFRKIQAEEPYRFGLGHKLGLVCLAQQRYDEAEKYFLNEIERYGDTFMRFKSLGDLYYMWGKREPCKDYYSRSLALCGEETDKRQIMHRIAQCANSGSFESAIKSYNLLKGGNTKMADKDYDRAYELFREAVKADACNFQAWNNLGALEMNIKKDIPESIKCFEKAASYTSLRSIHDNLNKARAALEKEKKK